jgi:hypothetical protein
VAVATTLAAMAGVYPTWAIGERPAVAAEIAAWLIVTLVAGSVTMFLVGQAKHGPVRLAVAFLFSATVKVIVSVSLGLAAWYAWNLEFGPLFLWICLFYAVNLVCQSVWLVRILRRS